MKIGEFMDMNISIDMVEFSVHENLVSRSFMVKHQDMRVLEVLCKTMEHHRAGIRVKCVSKCPVLNMNWVDVLSSMALMVSLELVEVLSDTHNQMFSLTPMGEFVLTEWKTECVKNGWNWPIVHCQDNCFLT